MSGRDARWDRVSRSARCSPWHPFWPTTKINGGSPSTASSNTRTPIWRPAPCKPRCLNLSLRHAETRLEIDAATRVFSAATHSAPRAFSRTHLIFRTLLLAIERLIRDFAPRDSVRSFVYNPGSVRLEINAISRSTTCGFIEEERREKISKKYIFILWLY